MKKIVALFTVLFCVVSCSSIKKETGDLQQFLINHFNEYSHESNYLEFQKIIIPKDISWEYKKDKDGFGVTVNGDFYNEINVFISELFGAQGKIDNDDTMRIYCLNKQKLRVQCSYYSFEDKYYVSINTLKEDAFLNSINQ